MSQEVSYNWTFYLLGATFILLGIALLLVPLIARSGSLSGIRVPWIILYTYNKGGFYFATSPILILISLVSFVVLALRR